MSEDKHIPALRFKGFTDPWEQRKLGEVTDVFSGGTPSVSNSAYYNGDIPFIRSAEIDSTKTELYLSKQGLEKSSARMVEVGIILYALYGATSGEVAISRINGAINQAILAIQPHEEFSATYITNWLRREKQNIIGTYLQGGQGNLSGAIVKELNLPVPSVAEQEAIGILFAKLDNLITLHQRKYDKLVVLKKSLLEKMFPKPGSKVPEIRFSGFTDPWEQRKLGEVATFSKGFGYSKSDIFDVGAPFIHYGRLYTSYETVIGRVDTFTRMIQGSVFSCGSEVITPSSGETADDIAIASAVISPGIILGGGLNIIHPAGLLDSIFLALSISYSDQHDELAKKAQGKSVVHLYNDDLKESSLLYPSIEEQSQIGALFVKLDSLITLHQRELDLLKNVKKSLLEKMFV